MIAHSHRWLNWLLIWIYFLYSTGAIHQILFKTTVIFIWIYIWKSDALSVRLSSTLWKITRIENTANTRRSITIFITRILRPISSWRGHNRFQNVRSSRMISFITRSDIHFWSIVVLLDHGHSVGLTDASSCVFICLSQTTRLWYHFNSVNRIATTAGFYSHNVRFSRSSCFCFDLILNWNLELFINLRFFTCFLHKTF